MMNAQLDHEEGHTERPNRKAAPSSERLLKAPTISGKTVC